MPRTVSAPSARQVFLERMQDSMLETDGGGRSGLVLEEAGGILPFVTKCSALMGRFEALGRGVWAAGVLPPRPATHENRSSVSE